MKNILLILFVVISLAGYSQIPVMGNIEPADPRDTYPTAISIHIKGSFTPVEDISQRDTLITAERRVEGQFCYVKSEDKFYQLKGGITNANWTILKMGDDVLVDLGTYVFDTIRLTDHDTKIWQLRMNDAGDTLFYNDQTFVSSGSGASLYLDADRPINFATTGTNIATAAGYSTMRLDSLVELVFYSALPPIASISGNGDHVIEYGSTNNVTLSWTATKTTNPITTITVDNDVITPTGNTQSGNKNVTIPNGVDATYGMFVEESSGLSDTDLTSAYYWRNRLYVGLEVTSLTPPDAYYSAITDGAVMAYPYDDLESAYNANDLFSISNASGGFIVVVAPTAFGQPKSWVQGGNPSMAIPYTLQKTWDFTNQYGYVTEYKMWVVPNKQNSNPLNFYLDEN